MLTAAKKRELLGKAHRLDQRLDRNGVQRSDLSPVLSLLFTSPDPWESRVRQAREIVERLPDSWLRHRAHDARRVLSEVRLVMREVLSAHRSPAELTFLLGWLARLAKMRQRSGGGR